MAITEDSGCNNGSEHNNNKRPAPTAAAPAEMNRTEQPWKWEPPPQAAAAAVLPGHPPPQPPPAYTELVKVRWRLFGSSYVVNSEGVQLRVRLERRPAGFRLFVTEVPPTHILG